MNDKCKSQVPDIVQELQRAGEKFKLLTIEGGTTNAQWLENNFPIGFASIDWKKVIKYECVSHNNDNEILLSGFEEIVVHQRPENNQNLIVSWSNGLKLPIQLDMPILRKYAESVFYEDMKTWLCDEWNEWVIENHHDGTICFGKCQKTNFCNGDS